MNKKARYGVFETNSSSTHTLTICDKEDFEKWKNGEMLLFSWRHKLVPIEEAKENIASEKYEERDYYTYEYWSEDEYLSVYEEEYTTKNGDEIVVFGKYGFDG